MFFEYLPEIARIGIAHHLGHLVYCLFPAGQKLLSLVQPYLDQIIDKLAAGFLFE